MSSHRFYGPEFAREGDQVTLTVDVLGMGGCREIEVFLEQRAAGAKDWCNRGALLHAVGPGVGSRVFGDVGALLRLRYDLEISPGSDAMPRVVAHPPTWAG